jgi:hypothetical protein
VNGRQRTKERTCPTHAIPALYQINTRVWLTELSGQPGRRATLDDVPDAELGRLAEMGFHWVWFLSVWQTGPAAQAISREKPEWRREFAQTLPDLKDEDITGSGLAIQSILPIAISAALRRSHACDSGCNSAD